MADGYWRRVHLRALADAGRELHIESRGRLVIAALGAIAAIIALAFLGSSGASQDELIARAAIGGIVILLFPFVYFWKFLGTPEQLEQELERKLSGQIDEQAVQITNLREQMKPCLKLAYGQNKAKPLSNGGKHTFLLAINEGRRDVPDAQVIIEEAMIKRVGSDSWERTDILARPNMSWGFKPDDHPQKYSTVQLPPGPSLIDFLIGPSRRGDGLGFAIRIDPLQRGIDPFFKDAGRYKFAMQLSSLHTEPEKLILFADWDGKNLVLRPDESSEVLEISGLSA